MKTLALVLAAALAARAEEPPSAPMEHTYALRVHLLTDDARVELRRAGADTFVCAAPCGTVLQLRPGDQFTLTGPGLAPSDDFTFRPRDGDVTLRVHPRQQAPRSAAKGLMLGGAIGLVAGGVIADVGVAMHNTDCSNAGIPLSSCSTGLNSPMKVGVAVFGAGLVVLLVGLITLAANPATDWEPAR